MPPATDRQGGICTDQVVGGGPASSLLPDAYRRAIDELTAVHPSHPRLMTLSDESRLLLAREILTALYCRKDEWAGVGDWAAEEARLMRLAGSAADACASGAVLTLASVVGGYLRTFVDALEYELGKECDERRRRTPELLARRRSFADDRGREVVAYGPTALPLPGNTFEVWTAASNESKEEEDDENDDEEDQQEQDREGADPDEENTIALVLGAGNQSFLSLIDVLDNALRRRRPVLVKHHPLRPWLRGPYGVILEPLIRRGYLAQVVDVSNDATGALLSHPAVGRVHVTGSTRTSEVVREVLRASRRHLSDDAVRSMITSELGCATPQVMDDGTYTEMELRHACRIIAFGKKSNGGCNCLSAQVVVIPRSWAQKGEFRDALSEELGRQPTPPCYYPGSIERRDVILERCGEVDASRVTLVTAPSLSAETRITDADQVVVVECGTPGEGGYNPEPLLVEAFGPVLAIVELDDSKSGDGEEEDDDYLVSTVVPFLNDKGNIFGSLSCSIFTPASKGDVRERRGMRNALAALQYGGVSINQWNALGYFTAISGGMWGGHRLEKLSQSGNGTIGDLYGIIGDRSAKSVVYGPPLASKPMFDLASPTPAIVFDVLLEFACSPSIFGGLIGALRLVARRSIYGFASYIPFINVFFKKKDKVCIV
ncbi:hypothetical protein ACHAW5_007424 [Stephanodiscus triporus]|uniref:Aldehyde dehydrogenase domain-containing protein n=1 Tax=Stephanodiscus triporus TaxID=2934178 RepID=A0ABD3P633_9STRA